MKTHENVGVVSSYLSGFLSTSLDSLKQGTTGNWILMTQMLAPANSAWVSWLCWLCWCSGKQASFYIIWMNCTVFAFSFVSSSNTDVETTEQFILLLTRYVCDFSGLTNFSQKLWSSKKTVISYFVYFFGFLLLTHDEFFDAFQGKKFRLETVCLFQRLVIGQLIRKSCFLDRLFACWLLRTLWASSFARSVKFLSLLSEWVGDWCSAWDNSPG